MLKAIILGCALCAGAGAAGGTAFLVKSGSAIVANPETSVSTLSIQEMHASAHMDGLPIQAFDAY